MKNKKFKTKKKPLKTYFQPRQNGNPSTQSTAEGWNLLGIILGCFPPSNKLKKYVSAYLQRAEKRYVFYFYWVLLCYVYLFMEKGCSCWNYIFVLISCFFNFFIFLFLFGSVHRYMEAGEEEVLRHVRYCRETFEKVYIYKYSSYVSTLCVYVINTYV